MSFLTALRGTPSKPAATGSSRDEQRRRRFVTVLRGLFAVLAGGYAAISIYIATRLVHRPPLPVKTTPASLGLQYRDITFPSREDGVQLRGWFIPGVLPDGQLTAERTVVMVHGTWQNRSDPAAGLLDLSGALARQGFAILAFDMRGMGESPSAPLSFGLYEQRDVLGAVDFLRSGPLPYLELGRSRTISGLGVSMGAATLLMASAQEPAFHAIVADSAYANIFPILVRQFPRQAHVPLLLLPGGLVAVRAIYGIDYTRVRPVNSVASIAPRPLLLIHGASDDFIPPANMDMLATAARKPTNADVQTWLVPGAQHAQSYHVEGKTYVDRVVAFFTNALDPPASGS